MSSVHEEWRPVPGYEGLYEVSNLGRVRSLPRVVERRNGARLTVRGRVRKLGRRPDGYLLVRLNRPGEIRSEKVHRLVALAFLGVGVGDVRHLNHQRDDNRAVNLAWGTRSENMRDSVRAGRHAFGERMNHNKLTEDQVREILADSRNRRVIAAEYGVHFGTITHIKRRLSWAHVEPGPGGVVPPRRYRKRKKEG